MIMSRRFFRFHPPVKHLPRTRSLVAASDFRIESIDRRMAERFFLTMHFAESQGVREKGTTRVSVLNWSHSNSKPFEFKAGCCVENLTEL